MGGKVSGSREGGGLLGGKGDISLAYSLLIYSFSRLMYTICHGFDKYELLRLVSNFEN